MSWYHQYTCKRCDVQWRAATDEAIADVCWMCEQNDATTVWTQTGKPVLLNEGDEPVNLAHKMWTEETRVGVL